MSKLRGSRWAALAFVSCLLAAVCAASEEKAAAPAPKIDPDAEKVIRQLADYYGGLKSFSVDLRLTITADGPRGKEEVASSHSIAVQKPNKFAVVLKEGKAGSTVVCDGENVYTYAPALKAYTVKKVSGALDAIADEDGTGMALGLGEFSVLTSIMSGKLYDLIVKNVSAGRYVGVEEVEGLKCHHMKLSVKPFDWDVWVEAGERPLLHKVMPDFAKLYAKMEESMPGAKEMKEMKMEMKVLFQKWAVNTELPEDTFKFRPPADAKQFKDFMEAVASIRGKKDTRSLLGKPAPQFKTPLLDGGEIDLAAHKGKNIVILDFWATWCGPCRLSMPILSEVAKSYKDKGVLLFAVNLEEDPDTIKKYLEKQSLTVTVALDEDGSVVELYSVEAIPTTVIVGKDGTIQSVHIGISEDMKEKLQKELDTLLAGKKLVEEKPAAPEEKPAEPAK